MTFVVYFLFHLYYLCFACMSVCAPEGVRSPEMDNFEPPCGSWVLGSSVKATNSFNCCNHFSSLTIIFREILFAYFDHYPLWQKINKSSLSLFWDLDLMALYCLSLLLGFSFALEKDPPSVLIICGCILFQNWFSYGSFLFFSLPQDCLQPLSMQALPAQPESLCIVEMGGTEKQDELGERGSIGFLYLNIGLQVRGPGAHLGVRPAVATTSSFIQYRHFSLPMVPDSHFMKVTL